MRDLAVGHRYLVRLPSFTASLEELAIVECSPQGRVKVRNLMGETRWYANDELQWLEDLGPVERPSGAEPTSTE